MKTSRVSFLIFGGLVAAGAVAALGGCQHDLDAAMQGAGARKQDTGPVSSRVSAAGPGDSVRAPVFAIREIMPSFPGGEAALIGYLRAHLHDPASGVEAALERKVVLQFTIARDGSLHDIVPVGARGDSALVAEAVRVVSGMPPWNPGLRVRDGKTMIVQYCLPVRFPPR